MSNSNDQVSHPFDSLKGFRLHEVLGCDIRGKTIYLHAKCDANKGCDGNSQSASDCDAVVILEKKTFDQSTVSDFMRETSALRNEMQNDIYGVYHMNTEPMLNEIKTTIIVPANPRHIEKYRSQDIYMLHETPHDYKTITLPYIQQEHLLKLDWVYNILDGKAEQDRVFYSDPDPESGFLLMPDMKWDGESLDTLYMQALVRCRNIKSIRDLTAAHLPMLEEIEKQTAIVLRERFNLKLSQMRLYFHYQPSYYHLHVHIVRLSYDAPAQNSGKAVLLADVIDNIKLVSDAYQKKTLCFYAKKTDGLYRRFVEAGRAE